MKRLNLSILAVILSIGFAFAGGYKIGDKATDFKLKNVDGNMVSMADYTDARGFIVVFTCNHCPVSKKYEQRIIDLDNKYSPLGYPVIAINPNDKDVQPQDSFEEMVKLAAKKGYPFPYLYDETQEIAKAYGATRTPHIFILSKEKDDLVVEYIGAIDNNSKSADAADEKYVEDAVDALLTGEELPITNTTAVGCTIKWSK
jgi:peroxiredoxin